ncbi:MAG: hypothetical protein DMF49_13095 [Acidobacteria bacterium]|nr:MAG: hypothetical protein DMF49_13095 [Acidobacteriota bacterium]
MKKTLRPILLVGTLLLAGVVAAFVVARWVNGGELRQLVSDRVGMTFLMIVIGLLLLALVYVLLRNLVKLLVERRREVLGSRFRTKLVVSFLILCFIPSVALFYAATTITLHFAGEIAREMTGRRLLEPPENAALDSFAHSWLSAYRLDYMAIFDREGAPVVLAGNLSRGKDRLGRSELATLLKPAIEAALRGKESSRIDRLQSGHLVSGVAPIHTQFGAEPVAGAAAGGYYLGEEIAAKTARIAQIVQQYKQEKAYRRETKRVYIAFFLLLTVLMLFSAIWLGLYLARQITVPIQKLAEGTREIAAGNLDFRVEAEAGDEIGVLIHSFNEMTADLQRKEHQLEERRRYIETLLENVPAGVISLDPDGRITTLNRAAYRLLGLEAGREIRGKPLAEAFSDAALGPLVEMLRDTAGAEGIRATRELTLAAGGRTVNLACIVSNFRGGQNGRSLGALVVLEDLTLLIRAQKSAAWREAARRIAHEIKNPLTPIRLSAERVLKRFRESSPDFTKVLEEGTATIIAEVGSLKAMVDEFSRFARIPPVSPAPNDPKTVVESALSLYDGTRPGFQFVRAFPGIPPEDRGRLFLPYFSTKRRGTGLGLSIVDRIVSDHAGTIRAEDNDPHGTRFIIEIPCAGEPHAR